MILEEYDWDDLIKTMEKLYCPFQMGNIPHYENLDVSMNAIKCEADKCAAFTYKIKETPTEDIYFGWCSLCHQNEKE